MTRVGLCGCVPALLGAFDFGFLALAGKTLAPALGASGSAYPWLFSTSSFAYGAAVMPAVALTARIGPERALALGLAGVAAGAGMLAATSGLALTLLARAVTGVGGALAATAAIALLASIRPEHERRAAFAALGGAVALGFAAGALAAGLPHWRLVLVAVSGVALGAAVVVSRLPSVVSWRWRAICGPRVARCGVALRAVASARSLGHGLRRAGGDGSQPRGDDGPRLPGGDGSQPRGDDGPRLPGGDGSQPRGDDGPRLPGGDGSQTHGDDGPRLQGAATLTAAIVCAAAGIAAADGGALWTVPVLGAAVVLATVALRRAAVWLPPRRSALAASAFAGAATTASGVGATVLIAPALSAQGLPGALLGVFGLAVIPGARLATRLTANSGAQLAAAVGLGLQASGLLGAAWVLGPRALPIAALLFVFGTGHVVANGGVAAAVVELAGPRATSVAGLLIAAQYVGGGIGPLLVTGLETQTGVLAAAAIAAAGALPIVALRLRPGYRVRPSQAA